MKQIRDTSATLFDRASPNYMSHDVGSILAGLYDKMEELIDDDGWINVGRQTTRP